MSLTSKIEIKKIKKIETGILMIQSGYYINSFHGIFGIYDLPYWISVIVSLFVFVVIVNALNLIDGLDGLASFLSIKFFLNQSEKFKKILERN